MRSGPQRALLARVTICLALSAAAAATCPAAAGAASAGQPHGGCELRPHGKCRGADLRSRELYRRSLAGIDPPTGAARDQLTRSVKG